MLVHTLLHSQHQRSCSRGKQLVSYIMDAIPTSSKFRIQHSRALKFLKRSDFLEITDVHHHQKEALLAIKKQFDDIDQPNIALVVLPTGCGKTGVAVLAPFVLDSHRVLVLTPSRAISEQIFKAFGGRQDSQDMFLVRRRFIRAEQANDVRPSCTLITSTDQIKNSLHNELLIITAHQVSGQSQVKIQDISPENYDLVIVDEAHHYPAHTWMTIVNHFCKSKRLFLTATPHHRSTGYILQDIEPHLVGLSFNQIIPKIEICYNLSLEKAEDDGIIRRKKFEEIGTKGDDLSTAMQMVSNTIIQFLQEHDTKDPEIQHQAMVLTQTRKEGLINPAEDFCKQYNGVAPPGYHCEMYVAKSKPDVLDRFTNGDTRTLVVVERLREGYDNNRVSVVAIVRNVQPNSIVLFSQFVGRAIRKAHPNDSVTAAIIAHKLHKQKKNYDQFDQVVDKDVIVD
ncbi:PREDICTED: uncharacterized protein LOC109582675 [Amphimedon queenslandica]|uniref:Helicase ATP-binding domain-containing protein n=1 Tax=Amphimedon queenslandica TaxID=400682 RepID=A0AAN0J8Q7_AMPQE|nr:PREDICTED: uncharacterized protein LOC109582675 [Amphimedon queenslandica]|eukprot:XP_019853093.1 PREDICTED: uncharacterized protein LOC109582675 [Amphimedon queenslandica]